MQTPDDPELQKRAAAVLEANWREGYTIPSARLYPFQWNWDSGFIGLGWLHLVPERAREEFATLFTGQWENGFLPHILFHREVPDQYFPNADFWESRLHPGAPKALKTSGITQPPVHGFVLEQIWQKSQDKAGLDFVEHYYERVLALHRYLYTERDPHREGLVFIYHPWESGRDNSPVWNPVYAEWKLDPAAVPPYRRVDNERAAAEERPTQDDYDRYVYLVHLGKKYGYRDREIAQHSPFLVQDTLFNAILIRSNAALIRLGRSLGKPVDEIKQWQQKALEGFNGKLWDAGLACYVSYDLRHDRPIRLREIGGLLPLFAGIPHKKRAEKLRQTLLGPAFLGSAKPPGYLCPTFDREHPSFESHKYWRGPIWINTNWMLYRGLQTYGFHAEAENLRKDSIELVRRLGLCEYFDPNKEKVRTGTRGYGSPDFSWTAALLLDFLSEHQ